MASSVLDGLKKRVAASESNLKALQLKVDVAKDELKEAKDDLQKEVQKIEQATQKLREELGAVMRAGDSYRDFKGTCEYNITEIGKDIAKLEGKKDRTPAETSTIAKLKLRLPEWKSKLVQVTAKLKNTSDSIRKLRAQIVELGGRD